MGFNCGIVGLPNVGKSTLFNALTATQAAEAQNYPFCTIEPNVGRVGVPDPRLDVLAKLAKSAKVIPTQLEFVDIAGLVRGASKGEGLGNKFLAHIREVDAIVHVLRCFESDAVVHVEGSIDPLRDAETVETELMLADLDSLERRVAALEKKAKGGDKEARAQLSVAEKALAALRQGKPARSIPVSADDLPLFRQLQLLTAKPMLCVCNVEEESAATGNSLSAAGARRAADTGAEAVVISAAIEAEVAQLVGYDFSLRAREPGKVGRGGERLVFSVEREVLREFGVVLRDLRQVGVIGFAYGLAVVDAVQVPDHAPGARKPLVRILERLHEFIPGRRRALPGQALDQRARLPEQRIDCRRDVLGFHCRKARQSGEIQQRIHR